jgi:threonine dehydratase
MIEKPTMKDVMAAHQVVKRYLSRTPLFHYAALSRMLSAEVWVKHENYHPVGAFKVRGGVNLVSQLREEESRRGIIAASTGNHGQSVAYAARMFGVKAMIGVPQEANPVKIEAIRNMGAEIIFHGKDFDDACVYVENLAYEKGYRYIHAGNEPLLIAGVATHTLEVIQDQPNIDVIIVPIGGGSGAAGACLVAKAINPAICVIGVQSEQAPAAHLSWKNKDMVEAAMGTVIEGLATRTAFSLPQSILWELLDDFVLVSDEQILRAVALMIEKTHSLAEGAGAAPLAAALKIRKRLRGKKVALILSGGNISLKQLQEALNLSPSF